ncbi:MAG TPA: hypothetical protein VMU78_09695 [Methylocella sp.]|nr:hypothetical protein [Methylocella sp.]
MRDMDWDLGFGLKWFNAQFSRTLFNAESFGMRFSVSASDGSGGGARDVPIPHPRAAFTPQLGGIRRLSLNVMPRRSKKRHSVPAPPGQLVSIQNHRDRYKEFRAGCGRKHFSHPALMDSQILGLPARVYRE